MSLLNPQSSPPKSDSDTLTPQDDALIQFDKLKAHLIAIEKASKSCDEYIDMMGIEKGRPQHNLKKDESDNFINYSTETSANELQSQLEQLRNYLKDREEYLQADLAYLKKKTEIEVSSPPSFFKHEIKTEAETKKEFKTSSPGESIKKQQVEESKSSDKDTPEKKSEPVQENQKIFEENQRIHAEIIEFRDLLEVMGGSTKEIGDIVTLNNKSDTLESLLNTNKSLRDQLLLISELLKKAGIEQKIESFSVVPQRSKQELSLENSKILEEIIEFRDLLATVGDPEQIGAIIPLNSESDNDESFSKTNKLLRDQLQLASDILKNAGIDHKIKSILCPELEKPVEAVPIEVIIPQIKKHVFQPLKPPVRNRKGEIMPEKPVLFTLQGDIFENNTLRIGIEYYSGVPEPDKKLGDATKLNEAKTEITPYADVWRSIVRNLISRYELVDIDRGTRHHKRAIVKYRDNKDQDETHGLFPVFSRAYFKLWEVLDITGILDKYKGKPINIASLAEGPGGFIHCLIDWRKKQNGTEWNKDSISAITLRNASGTGDQENLDWDSSVNYTYWKYAQEKHTINLSYGPEKEGEKGTGDLLQKENLKYFKEKDLKGQKCALVTADGGIHLEGDQSYSIQEVANIKLFFAEAFYALSVQEIGGSFVMKTYDIYFEITVELLLLLAFYYEKVTVFKPLTSRPASSEKYIIAEGFKGISEDHLERLEFLFFESLFSAEKNRNYLENKEFARKVFDFDVNEERYKKWKEDLAKGNEMQMKAQIEAIEYGLGIASINHASVDKGFLTQKRNEQKDFCIAWCQKHGIPYIEDFKI